MCANGSREPKLQIGKKKQKRILLLEMMKSFHAARRNNGPY
jgi:hypothetical protein